MSDLAPRDIVVYEGDETEAFIGRIGIISGLYLDHASNDTAWKIEWIIPPRGGGFWAWERNLRKLGEVPHG